MSKTKEKSLVMVLTPARMRAMRYAIDAGFEILRKDDKEYDEVFQGLVDLREWAGTVKE